jgi:uncharacterized lipoprotein YddW (UPF0748 family)
MPTSTAVVTSIALVAATTMSATWAQSADLRLRLSSPVTHSDWFLANDPAPAWGPEGVRQILDRAKECGWTRVYWRCFDSGKSMYASKLLEPFDAGEPVNYWTDHGWTHLTDKMKQYDYGEFDTFAEAVSYGHKIGLEVHAWLTINEDDHGYGWRSRFAREHPEFVWVTRDGRRYHSQMSYAFPQVRAYKLALVKEILAYKPDGIFFDWIRTGDVRDNPQTDPDGIANYGYEVPNIERFRTRYGVDPHDVPNNDERWIAVRAEPQTEFMRAAHAVIKQADPKMVISVMTQHPWGYRGAPTDTPYAGSLPGLLVDIKTWAREGLIDEATVAGYYREGGTPEKAYRYLQEETEGRIPLWLYSWLSNSPDQFRADVALAERLGAVELLLWESNYIGLPPANAEAVKAMWDYAHAR